MAHTYDFYDEWEISAPLALAWEAISDSAAWQKWWPGLKSVNITRLNAGHVGSQAALTWQSKSGYHLRHTVTITSVEPGQKIMFSSSGDLVGQGSWGFKDVAGKTTMPVKWHVQTTKPWMNIFSFILKPLFIANHSQLMKQGETGLNAYLNRLTAVNRTA